jgi:hypothetical protein
MALPRSPLVSVGDPHPRTLKFLATTNATLRFGIVFSMANCVLGGSSSLTFSVQALHGVSCYDKLCLSGRILVEEEQHDMRSRRREEREE